MKLKFIANYIIKMAAMKISIILKPMRFKLLTNYNGKVILP